MTSFDMARISYSRLSQNEEVPLDNIPEMRKVPGRWYLLLSLAYMVIVMAIQWKMILDCPQFSGASSGNVEADQSQVFGSEYAKCLTVIVSVALCLVLNLTVTETIYFFVCVHTEWTHRSKRHRNSTRNLLKFVYKDHPRLKWLATLSLLSLVMVLFCGKPFTFSYMWMTSLFSLPYLYLLVCKVPNFNELSVLARSMPSCGADFGAQFYFGYLRHLLPHDSNCDRERSLALRIENFSEKNDISIPVRKLFLILPFSCEMKTDLSYCPNDGRIKLEKVMQLEPKVLERGVNRTYDNTVYKIIGCSEDVYLVAEVATALLTLYEMSESNTCTFLSRKNREEHFYQFCCTLEELLMNDRKCSDTYILVFYNEAKERSAGQFLPNILLSYFRKEERIVNPTGQHIVQDIEAL